MRVNLVEWFLIPNDCSNVFSSLILYESHAIYILALVFISLLSAIVVIFLAESALPKRSKLKLMPPTSSGNDRVLDPYEEAENDSSGSDSDEADSSDISVAG